MSDPRTFRIIGDHDGESGGGCFWIENERGESQSLNFGSRFRAQEHLDWLIREFDKRQLDWRGKNIRQLTPDGMQQFAIWALREITRLRQERDAYLGRAIRAENAEQRDIRWGVNVLLEKIAKNLESWETMDIWRSDAAMVVRGFKHQTGVAENACGNDPVQS
jgi:hypothetical protein